MSNIGNSVTVYKQKLETVKKYQSKSLEVFSQYLPSSPYCTDDLSSGLRIRSKKVAMNKRYIQPNAPTDLRWLLYDIDSETASTDWLDCNVPFPNIVAINPDNGHGAYFYLLKTPVYTQRKASSRPVQYLKAIDDALTRALHADPHYVKLVVKNPLHPYWQVFCPYDEPYELCKLECSAMNNKCSKRQKVEPGLGRNCDLFDMVRFWAYREIRKPQTNDFVAKCIDYAREHNNFSTPLPDRECRTIGKSIGNWVLRNLSDDTFRAWCARRGYIGGKKSGEVRANIANEKAERVYAYKAEHPDATISEMARQLKISRASIYNYLK